LQIADQQAKTAVTLHSVQKDAETIRRVYEGLGDTESVELEIVADDDQQNGKETKRSPEDDTIRFQSFRRSLDSIPGEQMPPGEDNFADGIAGNMRSTVNGTALDRIILNHKERKSVIGLFDILRTPELLSTDGPGPFATGAYSSRTDLCSPTLSSISVTSPSPINEKGPTLGSELGNEFGNNWDTSAVNHHLRNTSLYQLVIPSAPASPILASQTVKVGGASSDLSPELPELQSASSHVRSVRPPHRSSPDGKHRGHQADRYQRLSQTIRLRTNQWADGRFKDSAKNTSEQSENTELREPLPPIPQRPVGMFNSVVGTLVGQGGGNVATSELADNSQEIMVKADPTGDPGTSANSLNGFSKVIFELWLWLQFFIIILVFLWTMAKRGPKSVIDDAERRRVCS